MAGIFPIKWAHTRFVMGYKEQILEFRLKSRLCSCLVLSTPLSPSSNQGSTFFYPLSLSSYLIKIRFGISVINCWSCSIFFSPSMEKKAYEIQEVVGKGSYGVVASAVDTHTGERVAIKKMNNIFEHIKKMNNLRVLEV